MKKDEDFIIGYSTKYERAYRELKKILSRRHIELKLKEGVYSNPHNRDLVIKFGDRVKVREIMKKYYKNNPDRGWILIDNFLKP